MVVEEVVRGEGPWGNQDIERVGLTPDMFLMEWVVGHDDAHEEAREEDQENLGAAVQVGCKCTRPDQIEVPVQGCFGCRYSTQEEGQEEGDGMKDSDSRYS